MVSRDAYFFQIMRKYNSSNGGVAAAYKEVCRHLEEVEAAKRALEDAMESKEERKSSIYYWKRANEVTDEMIKLLEDAGYDVENASWENMLKDLEEWEKKMKEKRAEEKEQKKEKQ